MEDIKTLRVAVALLMTAALAVSATPAWSSSPVYNKATEAKIVPVSPTTVNLGDTFSFAVWYKEKGTTDQGFVPKTLSAKKAQVQLFLEDPVFKVMVPQETLKAKNNFGLYSVPTTGSTMPGAYQIVVSYKQKAYDKKLYPTAKLNFTVTAKSGGGSFTPPQDKQKEDKKGQTTPLKKTAKVPNVPETYSGIVSSATLVHTNLGSVVAGKKLELQLNLLHNGVPIKYNAAGQLLTKKKNLVEVYEPVVKIAPVVDTTPTSVEPTASEDPAYNIQTDKLLANTTYTADYKIINGKLVVDLMTAASGYPLPGESVPFVVYVQYNTGLTRAGEMPVYGVTNLVLFTSPISNLKAAEVYAAEKAIAPPPQSEPTGSETPKYSEDSETGVGKTGGSGSSGGSDSSGAGGKNGKTKPPTSTPSSYGPNEDQPEKPYYPPKTVPGSSSKKTTESDEPTASETPDYGTTGGATTGSKATSTPKSSGSGTNTTRSTAAKSTRSTATSTAGTTR